MEVLQRGSDYSTFIGAARHALRTIPRATCHMCTYHTFLPRGNTDAGLLDWDGVAAVVDCAVDDLNVVLTDDSLAPLCALHCLQTLEEELYACLVG